MKVPRAGAGRGAGGARRLTLGLCGALLCSLALALAVGRVASVGAAHRLSIGSVPAGVSLASERDVAKGSASAFVRPSRTAGCGHAPPVAPGTSGNVTLAANPAISEGFSTRSYRVHPPATYDSAHPLAALLDFHGYGGSAAGQDSAAGFSPLADRDGFLAVYPQGLPDGPGGPPFWASVGPIDYGINDIAYTGAVLDSLERSFCLDTSRIYVTGFSNGGGMVGFLACEMANRIAAFAPVSGNFYAPPGGCAPSRPVPILDFHGTNDTVLPYEGLPARENPEWPLPPILGWLADWAARDGCAAGPVTFLSGPAVTGLRWTGCRDGTTVTHYRIVGGGHAWPSVIDGQAANEVIWRFCQAYTLPG